MNKQKVAEKLRAPSIKQPLKEKQQTKYKILNTSLSV